MKGYDEVLGRLGNDINRLSLRSRVGLFWACASGLMPAYKAWTAAHEGEPGALIDEALAMAETFAVLGVEPVGAASLLRKLEAATPAGDSPGSRSSMAAQDAWICADIGIRLLVEPYNAGPAIEFALEPIVAAATEQLFGVSQIGSGAHEKSQDAQLLRHDLVARAINAIRWSIDFLRDRPAPSIRDLESVRDRTTVLVP